MIQIEKNVTPPGELTTDGRLQKQEVCDEYDSDPDAFLSGASKLPKALSSIYGRKSVKKALMACQFGKCCFSEVKFVGDYGDIEHFRPKACVVDVETKQRLYPGYYWLAYEWDNLFVCSEILNRSFKKNYFPLRDNSVRARSHHDFIENEEPLLVDPASDDPRDHIRFHEDEPEAHRKSIKGRTTIDVINLNHPQLAEARRDHLARIRKRRNWLIKLDALPNKEDAIVQEIIGEIRASLEGYTKKESEFSSMAIDFLIANPLP